MAFFFFFFGVPVIKLWLVTLILKNLYIIYFFPGITQGHRSMFLKVTHPISGNTRTSSQFWVLCYLLGNWGLRVQNLYISKQMQKQYSWAWIWATWVLKNLHVFKGLCVPTYMQWKSLISQCQYPFCLKTIILTYWKWPNIFKATSIISGTHNRHSLNTSPTSHQFYHGSLSSQNLNFIHENSFFQVLS